MGVNVHIVSATYEECPCDVEFARRASNLYPCDANAYRLVVVAHVDVPRHASAPYEGLRSEGDVQSTGLSEQCFGFPREVTWTTTEEAGSLRTVLTMKSACMSLGETCDRFNRCHSDHTRVSDYSVVLNKYN